MNDLEQLRARIADARGAFLTTVEPGWVAFIDQQQAALTTYLADVGIDTTDPGQALALFAGAELMHRMVPLEPWTFRVPAAKGVLGHIATITQGT